MTTTKETIPQGAPRSVAASIISPYISAADRAALEVQAAEDEVRFAAEARQAAEQAGVAGRAAREREAAFEAQKRVLDRAHAQLAEKDDPLRYELEGAFADAQADQNIGLDQLFGMWVRLVSQQELTDRLHATINRITATAAGAQVASEPDYPRRQWTDLVQESINIPPRRSDRRDNAQPRVRQRGRAGRQQAQVVERTQ